MLGDDLVERRGLGLVPLVALGLGDRLPLMRRVRPHPAKSASSVPSGERRRTPQFGYTLDGRVGFAALVAQAVAPRAGFPWA